VLQPDGNLLLGLAQLDALEALGPQQLASSQRAARATLQLADMNLRADTLEAWLAESRQGPVVLLAVSEPKMAALPERSLDKLDLLIANSGEWWAAGGNTELARRGLRRALVTQGAQGVRLRRMAGWPVALAHPSRAAFAARRLA
jgi:pseudouridine kinase